MTTHRVQAAAAVTGLALALVGCGSSGDPAHHAAKPPAVAATQSRSCADRVHAWAYDQGLAQMHQLGRDETVDGKAAVKAGAALASGSAASQLATWQADATQLETDAQAAAANPPPACADAADYGTAMQDYTTAAKDQFSAINDINSGNYTAADTLVNASSSAVGQGNNALSQANTTISGLDS